MRKITIVVLALVLLLGLAATPVFAKGPTEAGDKGVPYYVPCNPNAWPHILICIMPHAFLLGTETTISEDGTEITVSQIPLATFNEETGEWEGPYILLKWSRAWEAATYEYSPYYTGEWTKQAWSHYKFWLNGSGPVTITRDDGETPTVEEVTEFIFFKVQWVGDGEGNSDFTVHGSFDFDITIQAYK